MTKPETAEVRVVRITPHRDAKGKRESGKWDTVEFTVRGEPKRRKAHETGVPLAVARERWQRLMADIVNVEMPETLE